MPTLRVMASVGEPIDPQSWMWYYEKVGKSRVPLVDTWWQTETGGLMIVPLPGATPLKPGSAGRPFFGVQTKVLNDKGEPAGVGEDGHLVITAPWPGMIRGTWGDTESKRFKEVYFSMFPGVFTTGDGCAIDADGDHWLKGRIDDVLNVSGHRIGTSDVEGALVSHPAVAEAAVVGYPHAIKGTGIYTYVTLIEGVEPSDELKKELAVHVRKVVGPIATPDKMQFAPGPAQDPLRQDHAPHPAQDRRGRVRRPGRHLHAGRPVGRRGPQGQQPSRPAHLRTLVEEGRPPKGARPLHVCSGRGRDAAAAASPTAPHSVR